MSYRFISIESDPARERWSDDHIITVEYTSTAKAIVPSFIKKLLGEEITPEKRTNRIEQYTGSGYTWYNIPEHDKMSFGFSEMLKTMQEKEERRQRVKKHNKKVSKAKNEWTPMVIYDESHEDPYEAHAIKGEEKQKQGDYPDQTSAQVASQQLCATLNEFYDE